MLTRWRHPELGDVDPALLFEAADRSGQVLALSACILERALALARGWADAGTPTRVAVNIAPRWLADAGLPEHVAAALERHGVPAERLSLELREASVIADPRRALETLGRLRAAGVHLALDELRHRVLLAHLPHPVPVAEPEDRRLVRGPAEPQRQGPGSHRPYDRRPRRRPLGLDVVAEGVADEAARAVLVGMASSRSGRGTSPPSRCRRTGCTAAP